MSGLVNGLGARTGLLGKTEDWKFANKAVLPGGIDTYTVCMIRSDHWNNCPVGTENPDISFYASGFHNQASNGDPLHDTMGGSIPALECPDGHLLRSCIAFDGNDDIQFGGHEMKPHFSFMRDDYTIDFWVRLNSVTGDQYMFGFPCKSGTCYVPDGHFACNLLNTDFRMGPMSNSAHGFIQTAHGLSTSTWYHLAYVRHGDTTYLFKDGALMTTGSVSSQIDIVCTGNVKWGYGAAGNPIGGQMCEMRVSKGIARWTSAFPKPTKAYF